MAVTQMPRSSIESKLRFFSINVHLHSMLLKILFKDSSVSKAKLLVSLIEDVLNFKSWFQNLHIFCSNPNFISI